jgi:oxygen-independent coproporphyrinogen-3 oxidase
MSGHGQYMREYHAALKQEIVFFAQQNRRDRAIRTLYFGGGTPSVMPSDLLLDTFGTLKSEFVFDKACEITIEVNPGTVTPEQIAFWKEIGINRVSVGVQSLNDQVLQNLGRYQTAADVRALIPLLAASCADVSVDLMLGLPGITSTEWKQQLHEIVTWPIMHLSLYFLSLDPYTRLERDVRLGKSAVPNEQEVLNLYYWSIECLQHHGLLQYEISNFARPGHESKHNRAYWERKPYKGFGLGAWSYDGIGRFQNQTNLMQYMQGIQRGDDITLYSEQLTPEQVRLEKIMLGLRQTRGVCIHDVLAHCSQEQRESREKHIKRLIQEQLVREHAGWLQLTPAGFAVENRIAVELSV